jgi:hypothetical protein
MVEITNTFLPELKRMAALGRLHPKNKKDGNKG